MLLEVNLNRLIIMLDTLNRKKRADVDWWFKDNVFCMVIHTELCRYIYRQENVLNKEQLHPMIRMFLSLEHMVLGEYDDDDKLPEIDVYGGIEIADRY